jgi:tetratricopeptide (TPR) repeat protein
MYMRSLVASAVILGLTLSVAGCGQVANLKARKHFKEANALYAQGEYRRAVAEYEEALNADPNMTVAYFYLGNSYDNLYRPTRQGEPDNDAHLQTAVTWYEKAVERAEDPKMRKLALEYLVAAYGPDKLNDPSRAEPLVRQMIDLEPNEPTNYFALAKIYEDAGRYEEAEAALQQARELRPHDPQVYMQLAGYYNRQGEFEKTIEALEQRAAQEQGNPEAFYTIATYYWDKAFRDFRLKDDDKREYIQSGIEATDKAIAIKPDYMEALTYKNLLLRLQANIEKDPKVQQALIKEADALRERAIELQKKKTAGIGE